jgi:hypothetical protein
MLLLSLCLSPWVFVLVCVPLGISIFVSVSFGICAFVVCASLSLYVCARACATGLDRQVGQGYTANRNGKPLTVHRTGC